MMWRTTAANELPPLGVWFELQQMRPDLHERRLARFSRPESALQRDSCVVVVEVQVAVSYAPMKQVEGAEKARNERGCWLMINLLRRSNLLGFAVIHDCYAAGDFQRLFPIVSNE